jgi:hypothetical protein
MKRDFHIVVRKLPMRLSFKKLLINLRGNLKTYSCGNLDAKKYLTEIKIV